MDARDPPPASPRPPGRDADGVRITPQPRRGARVLGALALAALAVLVGWRLLGARAVPTQTVDGMASRPESGEGVPSKSASPPSQPTASARAAGRGTTSAAVPRDGEDPTPDLSDYVLPGEAPTMARVIDELHRRGIRSGLGAFQPPGTSPPLLGLEVPEGFELPEGYVRHHQATDDGQRIAPILMFSPDFRFFDAQGRPVALPANRVVPPELAPPGMPLRQVRIPPPRDGGAGP